MTDEKKLIKFTYEPGDSEVQYWGSLKYKNE